MNNALRNLRLLLQLDFIVITAKNVVITLLNTELFSLALMADAVISEICDTQHFENSTLFKWNASIQINILCRNGRQCHKTTIVSVR